MPEHDEAIIDCPKCREPMRKLTLDETIIDRCEACWGIWLDAGERLKVTAKSKTAAMIDIGQVRKDLDEVREVECPRCHVTMTHRRHPDQKHIGFEECSQCKGSFFDAGELRDLSKFSLSDIVGIFVRRG